MPSKRKPNKAKPATAGETAEQQAFQYLKDRGLKLITQNYHCRQGEIDLIMNDNGTLVFVEVRYRKNANYGSALESVTVSKQRKIIIAAQHYLNEHKLAEKSTTRFDVLGICGNETTWVKSAF